MSEDSINSGTNQSQYKNHIRYTSRSNDGGHIWYLRISDPNAVVYRCLNCGAGIGVTTHSTLYIGGARFRSRIKIRCCVCDSERTWRPSNENVGM